MLRPRTVARGLRRRWVYLLPVVFVTYSLAYLDRANYGFGAAAGLAQTLNISNARSAFLGSLFFSATLSFRFRLPVMPSARAPRCWCFWAWWAGARRRRSPA